MFTSSIMLSQWHLHSRLSRYGLQHAYVQEFIVYPRVKGCYSIISYIYLYCIKWYA